MELPERGETVLETARLRLRRYQASDIEPLIAMNADAEVMRYLAGPWAPERSRAMVAEIEGGWDAVGLGMLPVERVADGAFLGIAGVTRLAWYPKDLQVGWRLLPGFWGHGFAGEAGRAWLGWAFARHGVPRMISIADVPNARSLAVMARLGMRLDHRAWVEEDGQRFEVAVHAVTKGEWGA